MRSTNPKGILYVIPPLHFHLLEWKSEEMWRQRGHIGGSQFPSFVTKTPYFIFNTWRAQPFSSSLIILSSTNTTPRGYTLHTNSFCSFDFASLVIICLEKIENFFTFKSIVFFRLSVSNNRSSVVYLDSKVLGWVIWKYRQPPLSMKCQTATMQR